MGGLKASRSPSVQMVRDCKAKDGKGGGTEADEDGLGGAGEDGGEEETDADHGLAEEPEGQEHHPEVCRGPHPLLRPMSSNAPSAQRPISSNAQSLPNISPRRADPAPHRRMEKLWERGSPCAGYEPLRSLRAPDMALSSGALRARGGGGRDMF